MDELLSIGQVASGAGVNASALRYYEKVGLLEPVARASGHRRYDQSAIRKLEVIGIAQRAGLSLDEIKLLITPVRGGSQMGNQLRELAVEKLPQIESSIDEMQAMKAWMQTATRCDCDDFDVCALFDENELPMAAADGSCC